MPKDQRTSPVENYRVTPEQKTFQKRFRQQQMVKKMLEAQMLMKTQELKSIQDLYRNMMISFEGLRKSGPAEPLKDVEGMDFQQEREMPPEQGRINY